ncbi:MAG: helix-turn-helix domain-containing protein [Micromonosporaceae bacterium]
MNDTASHGAARAYPSRPDEGAAGSSDTRTRIQRVALELFTERGYDKTSLREIAERLGVTKAALYYHFRSKEEIVEGFLGDRLDAIEEMIAWLRARPRTPELRREFVLRYARILDDRQHQPVMRFLESNQAVVKGMPIGLKLRERFRELVAAMVDPDEPLTYQLRVAMGLWALQSSWFVLTAPEVTDEQRQAAALQVALELVSGPAGEG